MSTFPATNSNEAVELIIDGGNQLHQIINEDATTEVQTESGPIPSVRKALADTFLFLDPIPWQQGSDEIAFNQLRTFDNNVYWAPTATLSTPIPMGVTPIGDSNWHLAPVSLNGDNKGLYSVGIEYKSVNEYFTFRDNEKFYEVYVKDSIPLPYTTIETDPRNDTNLISLIEATQDWVESGDPEIIAEGTSQKRSLKNRAADCKYLEDFGATGLGVISDSNPIAAAIDWIKQGNGRKVKGRDGSTYAISEGITIPWDGKFLDETSACELDLSNTEIIPLVDNITVIKASRNYVTVRCGLVNNRNSRLNITAYAIAPEDYTQSVQKVSQMFCTFFNPVSRNCSTHFRLQPGPTINGENSGSYYNDIWGSRSYGTSKGFHFARCVTGDNLTTRTNIYSPKQFGGNCMFDIEAADTLDVYSGTSEFVNEEGDFPNKPTIKIHKPIPSDSLSSSLCIFHNFKGEVGNVPYDMEDTESCAMPNALFFSYAQEGITGTYTLTNSWSNEGAIVSKALYSSDATPLIGVRRDIGSNQGQAYLRYLDDADFPAEFYADRGFTFTSPIKVARVEDLQNTNSNTQILGSSLGRFEVTGSPSTGTVSLFNTSGLSGRGFTFGGVEHVGPDNDNTVTGATASNRYKEVFSVNGVTTTSDGDYKTDPLVINDKILDAWGNVSVIMFKWLKAVEDKGELARTHFGVIAQQVRDSFLLEGLDATKFGFLCYDEWEDEIDEDGRVITHGGSRWGIRADQCLFLEAAYQRRERLKLEQRISTIEKKLGI